MKKRLLYDIIERVVWTFVQAFSGVMTGAAVFNWNVPLWQQAAAGGVAAVFSSLKGIAASRLGTLDTASTLPLAIDEPGEK